MTAGSTEVVSNDVVRKVEIEEKCVAGLDMSDLNGVGGGGGGGDGNVGGHGNGNVGGDRKEDSDDSSYVFVSDVPGGGDAGDAGGVNVGAVAPKSESADEVDQFKKEELGIESNGITVDVKAVKDEVALENGSTTVDLPVVPRINDVAEDVNGHLGEVTGEEGVVVDRTDEVEGGNGIVNVEAETDVVSGVTFDSDPALNPIESSQVTVFESEPTNKLSEESESVSTPDLINTTDESLSTLDSVGNTDCKVMANDGLESVSTLIDKAECQVTVDGSDMPPEDLEYQVPADGSESSGGPIKERESQVIVDASGMPSDDLECQVTSDGSEPYSEVPIKELECQVTVDQSGQPSEDSASQVIADGSESSETPMKERELSAAGSESIGSLVDNQECSVLVNGLESSGKYTEEVDSSTTVINSDRKSEDSLIVTPEVDVEAETNQVYSELKVEHQSESVSTPDSFENKKTAETVIGSGTESEENPVSELVLSETPDAPVDGQVEKSDGILEMGDAQMSQTEADSVLVVSNGKEEKSEEKEGEGNSENLVKITESVELDVNSEETKEQAKTEDVIKESEIVATDDVQNDLDLEANTAESVIEAEAPLKTETNIEPITHEVSASQNEVSSYIDDTQEAIPADGSDENVEKQGKGSSGELIEVTGSVELDANFEETKEQVETEDKIQESETVVTENVQNHLDLEDNTAESTTEAEAPLETETKVEPITHEITASHYEVSSCVDETQEAIQPEGSTENVETLPYTDSVKSECKSSELVVEKENDSLSNNDDLTVVEAKVEVVAHPVTENRSAEGMDCGNGIENVDDDEQKETKVKDDEPVADNGTLSFPDTNVNPVAVIEFGSIGRHEAVHDMPDDDGIDVPAVVNGEIKPTCVTDSDNAERYVDGSQGDRNSDKMSSLEVEDVDVVPSDEIPTSSADGSVSDALDVPNEEAEVLAYNFLIRIPRFEDETLRDQIRSAQVQVEEKTRLRDAIRVEIQGKRARLKAHNEEFNAAKLEETAARRLVRLKRQEIDSVQSVINRVKNAMSVKDIDGRIYNMEHMIQHETLCLKDEKQFIREIKQLKTLRDQLASNMGSQDEVQQALDQKDQNEERMKTLRKELDSLKDKVSKAEAAVMAVGKKYDEESKKERELQAQFRAADDVRQKAYAHLNSLKKQTYDKNKNFRLYKEDAMAARDFASRGDKDSLHRLCATQVESFMEQWNNNAEFRNEYISRCNMNATRRQRTLDGGSLGPEDVFPVLPTNVNERVDRSLISIPGEAKSVTLVSAAEQGKMVSSAEDKNAADNKSIENLSGQKNQTLKTKGVAKLNSGSDMPTVTERDDEAIEERKEEENKQTKEEMELARKAEELRKEEIAAKLKEQRRLEEKAKATEALERKKRNAEKAQIRAELRAKKEAEQKEKEREKRLRKKEKKKVGGEGSVNGEEVASSESSNEATTTKEVETVKEIAKKKTAKPPAHFFSKQLKPKPVPPPLANRNRKRWQQWGKLVLAAIAILALFLLGNTGFFLNLRVVKTNGAI